MNSKELLEQATAKANQINYLINDINRMEEAIPVIRDDALEISGYDIRMRFGAVADKIKQDILICLVNTKNEKALELEKLIGLKNNYDVKLTLDANPDGDKIEKKLSEIIKKEEQKIKGKPKATNADIDKFAQELLGESAEKHQSKRKSRYPENMTIELVTEMYCNKMMPKAEIADHFKVRESTVNNYIYLKGIKRKKVIKENSTEKPENKSESKELP